MQPGLHLKNHTLSLRPHVGLIQTCSLQIMDLLHLNPKRIDSISRSHVHICICLVISHDSSSVVWLVPLSMCSRHGRVGVIGWWSSFVVWRMNLIVVEINRSDIMYACSSLVFPTRMLPYEVLLSVASHLCWCSGDHIISRNVSPIPFAILLKPQKK